MAVQLLRNARVVLIHEGIGYSMNALSSFSTDTSYSEISGKRKTLFSRTAKKYSIVNRQNTTSFSMDVLLTDSSLEKVFFELAGLEDRGNGLYLPTSIHLTPKLFSIYIINTDNTIELTPCYLESIDIALTKESVLSASISISAARREIVKSVPVVREYMQGNPRPVTPILLSIGGITYNNVTSIGISVQQECSWRDDKSYFAPSGSIYSPTKAYTSDLIISYTVIMNLDTNNQKILPDFDNVVISKGGFSTTIDNARIIPRITPSQVYTNSLDISPVEDSGNVYFTFGE